MPRVTREARYAHGAAKREKIRSALIEMLPERPLEEITMAQIAQRVGISSVTLYKYYSSRDSLVGETFHISRLQAIAELKGVVSVPGDPLKRIEDGIRHLFRHAEGQYTLFTAFVQSIRVDDRFSDNARIAAERLTEAFSIPIREGIESGLFRELDLETATFVLFNASLGFQHFALVCRRPFDVEHAIVSIRKTILDGWLAVRSN